MKNFQTKVGSFPDRSWDRFLIDFGAILPPSWEPKSIQKGGWENDEKMMMTRMAKKSDIGGYGGVRHQGFEARGGGGKRAKPLLQYSTKDWM